MEGEPLDTGVRPPEGPPEGTKHVPVTCPDCSLDTVCLTLLLTPKPLGTFSLSGQQFKVSAVETPYLSCWNCGWKLAGQKEWNVAKARWEAGFDPALIVPTAEQEKGYRDAGSAEAEEADQPVGEEVEGAPE